MIRGTADVTNPVFLAGKLAWSDPAASIITNKDHENTLYSYVLSVQLCFNWDAFALTNLIL